MSAASVEDPGWVGYVQGGPQADFMVRARTEPDGSLFVLLHPPLHRAAELSEHEDSLVVTHLDQIATRLRAPVRWVDPALAGALVARQEGSIEPPTGLTRDQTKQVARVPKPDAAALARAGGQDPHRPGQARGASWSCVGVTPQGSWVVIKPVAATGFWAHFPVQGDHREIQLFDPIGSPPRQLGGTHDPGLSDSRGGRWRAPSVCLAVRNDQQALFWLAGQGLTVRWFDSLLGFEQAAQYVPRALWPQGPLSGEPAAAWQGWAG